MTSSPTAIETHKTAFQERSEQDDDEPPRQRRSRKNVAPIKRPPRCPPEDTEWSDSVRRTRTVPSQLPADAPAVSERRSRRNLSRAFLDEFGDDVLLDSSKRISTSRRNLQKAPSERVLKASLSKKNGRAATPLDIPFAPNPALARTLSAETRFEETTGEEDNRPTTLRRTQTQVSTTTTTAITANTGAESSTRAEALSRDSSLKLDLDSITRSSRDGAKPCPSISHDEPLVKDSVKELAPPRRSKKAGLGQKEISGQETGQEHVIDVERPSRKEVSPNKGSSKKVVRKSSQKSKRVEAEVHPLTRMQILLHYIGLIFVQYPFKYHRQWLEKMYKSKRLERPANHKPIPDWALSSNASSCSGYRGGPALPSLPEDGTGYSKKNARIRRRTQLDGGDSGDEFTGALESQHGKRSSRSSDQFRPQHAKPPPGHLPRSHNISEERTRRKKSRKSVEVFGDLIHALGINTKGGKLKLPFGLAEMDESELSGLQARFYKFIRKQHKGRLARAWDHMIHPLGSMQRKHRRSPHKTRLLNAIDKHRAQKFENGLDIVKTSLFLFGQWMFEALSPPKYTKKPMLFTVLFPLLLVLFFGFMAGEYPQWKQNEGEDIGYEFGPTELLKWFFRSEKWRTFDDRFLIVWGARYLPLVTTESWRWVFSMIVHENFAHLGGNLLLFVILAWSLESKYGFFRTGLICWLSGISGNFISAALEDSCGIVLGASGCVFGLAAFYIVDVVGDFKSVTFPFLRLIAISTFLFAFIIALTSHQDASHLSHIGGFLCGLGLSVVLVPRFIDERIEACLPWVALFSGILLLCVFPLVVLLSVVPNLQCNS